MQNNSPKDPNNGLSDQMNQESKNISCKDGFCFIPNLDENKSSNNDSINIFDPI